MSDGALDGGQALVSAGPFTERWEETMQCCLGSLMTHGGVVGVPGSHHIRFLLANFCSCLLTILHTGLYRGVRTNIV